MGKTILANGSMNSDGSVSAESIQIRWVGNPLELYFVAQGWYSEYVIEISSIALLTIGANFVGTLAGFGTSTIMVPLLALFFPLPQAILLGGTVHWFGNIWRILLFRGGLRWKTIAMFGVPGVMTSILGALLAVRLDELRLAQILGGIFIAYGAFLFFNPSFRLPQRMWSAGTGGAISGFLAGVSGVGGGVRALFLSAFDLPKAVFIFTSASIALVIDSVRLVTYVWEGVRLEKLMLFGLLVFIPASFLGVKIAERFVEKIPQKQFRVVVTLFLFLVGVKLLIFP